MLIKPSRRTSCNAHSATLLSERVISRSSSVSSASRVRQFRVAIRVQLQRFLARVSNRGGGGGVDCSGSDGVTTAKAASSSNSIVDGVIS